MSKIIQFNSFEDTLEAYKYLLEYDLIRKILVSLENDKY